MAKNPSAVAPVEKVQSTFHGLIVVTTQSNASSSATEVVEWTTKSLAAITGRPNLVVPEAVTGLVLNTRISPTAPPVKAVPSAPPLAPVVSAY